MPRRQRKMRLTAPIWTNDGLLMNRTACDTANQMSKRVHWHKKMRDINMLWVVDGELLSERYAAFGFRVSLSMFWYRVSPSMVFFDRLLSRSTAVVAIFPQRDYGSAAPFSRHRVTSKIVRSSRSLRTVCSGVLGEIRWS